MATDQGSRSDVSPTGLGAGVDASADVTRAGVAGAGAAKAGVLTWRVGRLKVWALDQPRVLGIVNVTPDSFSDGGRWPEATAAAEHALRLLGEGADGVDVGGESTRPGARSVSEAEQIARVVPTIAALRARVGDGPVITIDTTRSAVARAALDAGADGINDVSGGTDDEAMVALAAERGCGLVLMHRLAPPSDESYSDRYGQAGQRPRPAYGDVVAEVGAWLAMRAEAAMRAGVAREAIALDPGLGFGKDVGQNLALIARGAELARQGFAVMSGASRKSFTARRQPPEPPEDRVWASLGLSVAHLSTGARVFRVHDVAAHRRGLDAAWAALGDGASGA
jgi:dihydropteroate synthase